MVGLHAECTYMVWLFVTAIEYGESFEGVRNPSVEKLDCNLSINVLKLLL